MIASVIDSKLAPKNSPRYPLPHLAFLDKYFDGARLPHSCSDNYETYKKSCNDTTFLEALLKISIERKVDLNTMDHEGRTPLHLMCMTRCLIYLLHKSMARDSGMGNTT